MAQGSYLSTYRTYKAGTKRLATWLVQASKLCGIGVTPSPNNKYQIPIGQFVHLAQNIIDFKEAGAILAKLTGRSVNDKSQAFHSHFITISENVSKILAPASPSSDHKSQTTAETKLANIFAALEVEEPSLGSGVSEPSVSKKRTKARPIQEYEVEESSADEVLFAILGFFKDYEEIEKVKRSPEGDEMACSMSFELADHLAMPVEDLLVQFANVLSKKPNPVYNGQLGYYRGDEIPVESSAPEQLDQARTLLMEYLPEITKMSGANMHLPVQDEITAGLRAMMDARRGMDGCPMYTIFATKLFLGVHGVLRVQHTQLFEELQATARRCVSTIDSYLRFSNNKQFTL